MQVINMTPYTNENAVNKGKHKKTYSAISGECINLVRTSTAITGLFSTNSWNRYEELWQEYQNCK